MYRAPVFKRKTTKLYRTSMVRSMWVRSMWVHIVLLSGCILRLTEGQCDLEEEALYPFGPGTGDLVAIGDDGPSVVIVLTTTIFRFYGYDYDVIYLNMNGQISFGSSSNFPEEDNSMTEFFPNTAAAANPPFLTPYWNDLTFTGNPGKVYYRVTNDRAIINKAHSDIGFKEVEINPTVVIIVTYYKGSSFDEIMAASRDPTYQAKQNTFQVVLVMDNKGNSFAMFHYSQIDWYIAHSLPAVAMMNQGQGTGKSFNMFASGSELMLTLDELCANGGANGRFIFQTDRDVIILLDMPSPSVMASCFPGDGISMYPYGSHTGDTKIWYGDDHPSEPIYFSDPVTFFGGTYNHSYVNINGPISFNAIQPAYKPTTEPLDDPPFMAAYWNDIRMTGTSIDLIYFRLTNDTVLMERFQEDVAVIGGDINPTELFIVTWYKVKMRKVPAPDDPINTFQVVFGYEAGTGRSYAVFIYKFIGWYQDPTGRFAVALFNKGRESNELLNVGPVSGPSWFFMPKGGNKMSEPGKFIYETGVASIREKQPQCVCKINSKKWIRSYDGMMHPFLHAQKNRMSRYINNTDPCKFQLSVRSTATADGNFEIASVTFAFGVHRNVKKFDKLIDIHRGGRLTWRGRQIKIPKTVPGPIHWTSEDNETQVSLVGDAVGGWILNSTTCPYRMQYTPLCPDPVLVMTIEQERYHPSLLIGMCQDCNGDPDNDYRPCSLDPTDEWKFWKKIPDLSKQCSIPEGED